MSTTNIVEHWYVISTKPKAEKKVSQNLSLLGITNYLPLQKQLRQWHDRKKWVLIPLFNSYIFVKLSAKQRNKVFEAAGVVKYVSIGNKVCIISAAEIQRIETLCSSAVPVYIHKENFVTGEAIQVIDGHFIGEYGYIIEDNGSTTLKLRIPSLGCIASVSIPKNMVQKILKSG